MENDSVRPVPFDSQSIAAAMLRARNSRAVREIIATARRAERRQAARDVANAVALVDAHAQAVADCATFGHLGWKVCARCNAVLRR